ncbi:hypothetical protein SAICODRAFT_18057 [Saitoella complicata NRRL Y-17804]|uniref:C2 domain-containing protein n=1 Tax=Saitoella complicata (strain BCRC 22490 / CBS 7301 / JCM 7358 / NBRC 10748 / NRRL Y-17804) TaxID=698492 RepID=A0A0E9NK92_SAICN|nr:uncharacterized protein SAICODRAFT_18057 [Saitoella complicata NRRL Y-17804]ODQ54527.1 hypothetical protein SAICODRAFT_18057 [Saitoella complicata NRRL Y-17804]GAO50106.1 hypothetical protein G7K_4241-t1 [Saitoella complicata NRRL Y-17804]
MAYNGPAHQHRPTEGYGAKNPVPTVQNYYNQRKTQDEGSHPREVVDPVTQERVVIEDITADHDYTVAKDRITVPADGAFATGEEPQTIEQAGSRLTRLARRDAKEKRVTPNDNFVELPVELNNKTNILYYPLPPPDWEKYNKWVKEWLLQFVIAGLGVALVMLRAGWNPMWAVLLVYVGWTLMTKKIDEGYDFTTMDTERQRGEVASQGRVPESVEWLNYLLRTLFPLIDPEMFRSSTDLIEDVMQASIPSIIHAVKIADLGQGSTPIRILSMRTLPDNEMLPNLQPKAPDESSAGAPNEEEEAGEFVNMEVAFAYRAEPSGADAASKAKNVHLLIHFYLGLKNFFGIPLPIWVEMRGAVGKVRLRMQFTPDPPFVKNLTFSLMGLPKIDVSAVPVTQRFVNVLNLPLISTFVHSSINAAAAEYVAPKSMTLDLAKILVGEDVKKDTAAMGVIFIKIHACENLEGADSGGKSDPYITVALSKYAKPLFSTRVIEADVNPRFEEWTTLLVTPEEVKAGEAVALQLWDSDRMSADDMLGRCEVDVQELMRHPGKYEKRVDTLEGFDKGSKMRGKIHWSVGYFKKSKFSDEQRTDGEDQRLPPELRSLPEFKAQRGIADSNVEADALVCVPDPSQPSGILSIQIHQIVGLEVQNITGSYGKKNPFQAGQKAGELSGQQAEDTKQAPSAYCNIILNDDKVYQTRSKPFTTDPIFNAGTERFIGDWRETVIMVECYDSRVREHDALLGVVVLKLSDIFATSSQVTKYYPLAGGLGFGRVRISTLFRSVEAKLDKNLLGWNVGTLQITSDSIRTTFENGADAGGYRSMKLALQTGESSSKLSSRHAETKDGAIEWKFSDENAKHLPIRRRYGSALLIELRSRGLSLRTHATAVGVLWLHKIMDNVDESHRVALFEGDDLETIKQSVVESHEDIEMRKLDVKQIGWVEFDAVFKAGMDRFHERFGEADHDVRQSWDGWECAVSIGERNRTGDFPIMTEDEAGHSSEDDEDETAVEKNARQQPAAAAALGKQGQRHSQEPNGGPSHPRKTVGPRGYHVQRQFDERLLLNSEIIGNKNTAFAGMVNRGGSSGADDFNQDSHGAQVMPQNASKKKKHIQTIGSDIPESHIIGDDAHHNVEQKQQKLRHGRNQSEDWQDSEDSEEDGDRDEPHGLRERYHAWREDQKELHRHQRGIMQFKPARTAAWAKDGANTLVGKTKRRFSMKARKPDVETEI